MKYTLCGSTRFKKEFESVNKHLTLDGHIVYSVAVFGHADDIPFTRLEKARLDAVHMMKILNSDAIFVIDVDKYIGESTEREIEFANLAKKLIEYYSEGKLDAPRNKTSV